MIVDIEIRVKEDKYYDVSEVSKTASLSFVGDDLDTNTNPIIVTAATHIAQQIIEVAIKQYIDKLKDDDDA